MVLVPPALVAVDTVHITGTSATGRDPVVFLRLLRVELVVRRALLCAERGGVDWLQVGRGDISIPAFAKQVSVSISKSWSSSEGLRKGRLTAARRPR